MLPLVAGFFLRYSRCSASTFHASFFLFRKKTHNYGRLRFCAKIVSTSSLCLILQTDVVGDVSCGMCSAAVADQSEDHLPSVRPEER